jgi:ABC-type transport system involved in cytochrome bd biosynthesis fused ATPase/permease subunit
MKLKVNAPIHAATAMLTATVTAMSIIDATTGLKAFLLLNIFILFYILLLDLLNI